MSRPQLPRRTAQRLTLHLRTQDHAHHGSLMVRIMQQARKSKMAGATVLQAHEGFGGSKRRHGLHLLSHDAPLSIIIIDTSERIAQFIDDQPELFREVLMTVEDVEIIER